MTQASGWLEGYALSYHPTDTETSGLPTREIPSSQVLFDTWAEVGLELPVSSGKAFLSAARKLIAQDIRSIPPLPHHNILTRVPFFLAPPVRVQRHLCQSSVKGIFTNHLMILRLISTLNQPDVDIKPLKP